MRLLAPLLLPPRSSAHFNVSGADGDAYSVSGIPTQLQYSITGFLDTNSNGVLDRLIDPHVHFLDGGLMPGTDFNDLNIDLPHVDPEGAKIRILSVEVSDSSAPLVRTITWRSILVKPTAYYSTATSAGPFENMSWHRRCTQRKTLICWSGPDFAYSLR